MKKIRQVMLQFLCEPIIIILSAEKRKIQLRWLEPVAPLLETFLLDGL